MKNKEYKNSEGDFHRIDGPAYISYFLGKVLVEGWFLNGKYHRTDGPAYTLYYSCGTFPRDTVERESWFLNGQQHRTDGPADIWYFPPNEIESKSWYLNDNEIFPEDWLKENNYKWPLNEQQQTELLLRFG